MSLMQHPKPMGLHFISPGKPYVCMDIMSQIPLHLLHGNMVKFSVFLHSRAGLFIIPIRPPIIPPVAPLAPPERPSVPRGLGGVAALVPEAELLPAASFPPIICCIIIIRIMFLPPRPASWATVKETRIGRLSKRKHRMFSICMKELINHQESAWKGSAVAQW